MQYKKTCYISAKRADTMQEKCIQCTRNANSRTPVITSGNAERLKTQVLSKTNQLTKVLKAIFISCTIETNNISSMQLMTYFGTSASGFQAHAVVMNNAHDEEANDKQVTSPGGKSPKWRASGECSTTEMSVGAIQK